MGWGGAWKKCYKLQSERWVHLSVRILVDENRKLIVDRFNASLECDVEDESESDYDSNAEEY